MRLQIAWFVEKSVRFFSMFSQQADKSYKINAHSHKGWSFYLRPLHNKVLFIISSLKLGQKPIFP